MTVGDPITGVAETIQSLLDLDLTPVPLDPSLENPDTPLECVVSVSNLQELDDEFSEVWTELKTTTEERIDNCEYVTQFIDISDSSERLIIVGRILGDLPSDKGHLKVEYHLSGTIRVKAMVSYTSNHRIVGGQAISWEDPDPVTIEKRIPFISSDLQSITEDHISQRRDAVSTEWETS